LKLLPYQQNIKSARLSLTVQF